MELCIVPKPLNGAPTEPSNPRINHKARVTPNFETRPQVFLAAFAAVFFVVVVAFLVEVVTFFVDVLQGTA